MSLLITCEHAGNHVPAEFQHLFAGKEEVLNSHRGWDPGALEIAQHVSDVLSAPLHYSSTTRLLIEANRSLHHPELFSEFTNHLSHEVKQELIHRYYLPYREPIESFIRKNTTPVLHLSIHSFTPIWKGESRTTDIGLLFDPDRTLELNFCTNLQAALRQSFPSFTIDYNKPYLGIDDGLTTYLRGQFSNERYCGIEIEFNQKHILQRRELEKLFAATVEDVLKQ